MEIISAINNLADRGVRVEIAFEETSIKKFLLWGVLAAIVAGVFLAIIKKLIVK
jgi:hypothetical protein